MVICGSYMHEFSVSKNMERKLTMIKGERGDNREDGGMFMSITNYQRIEN